MRILLRVSIPHERFNEAVRKGTAGQTMNRILEDTKPGQTKGEGSQAFGAGWDALSPAGKKIERGG